MEHSKDNNFDDTMIRS